MDGRLAALVVSVIKASEPISKFLPGHTDFLHWAKTKAEETFDENQARFVSIEQGKRLFHGVTVVLHAHAGRDPVPAINIADFSDGMDGDAALRQRVEHARRRLDGIIAPVCGPHEGAGPANKGPGNYTVDVVRRKQHRARALAPIV